ncbi:DUF357 domain-containing protein [archaeon]|jgi:uncharacterized protein|nr:DUF357 domain-containing protein [archaeon]MBT4241967.1 DUF357 domain-containing protein [archaeon]MBT4418514.1 DUF357 domain-containing protein [archaeon]
MKAQLKNKITKEKIKKYYNLSSKAIKIAKKSIAKGKEKQAKEIVLMVECYLSDSQHFEKNKDYVNAFAALNYAHGWIDAGARLKIFKVKDNNLFTI